MKASPAGPTGHRRSDDLARYAGASMARWDYDQPGFLEIRYEDRPDW